MANAGLAVLTGELRAELRAVVNSRGAVSRPSIVDWERWDSRPVVAIHGGGHDLATLGDLTVVTLVGLNAPSR